MSGLLFLKNIPDSNATRVVFQNEMGITYFDFGWTEDSFHVFYIIDQMNKPALIKALRKDFEMILFRNIDLASQRHFKDSLGNDVFRFDFWNAYTYYCQIETGQLQTIDLADNRKEVVHIVFRPPSSPGKLADNIDIYHRTATFTISLKKIKPDAAEK